eukprot:7387513-Prymnesium_polylepis.1
MHEPRLVRGSTLLVEAYSRRASAPAVYALAFRSKHARRRRPAGMMGLRLGARGLGAPTGG